MGRPKVATGERRRCGRADPSSGSRACLEELNSWPEGTEAAGLTHAQLEEQLNRPGRELLRRM